RRLSQAMGTRLDDLVAGEQAFAEWQSLRPLLEAAAPEKLAEVMRILAAPPAEPETAVATQVERVAVIGLRGAGKSTLGRLAAQRIGWDFIELDQEIEV